METTTLFKFRRHSSCQAFITIPAFTWYPRKPWKNSCDVTKRLHMTLNARPSSSSSLSIPSGSPIPGLASCIPADAVDIQDEAAQYMLSRLQYTPVTTELCQEIVHTSHVISKSVSNDGSQPVLIFLHGFDSNLLEFRYMLRMLDEAPFESHFIDILGWGLTERPITDGFSYGPLAKRLHLQAYIDKFASNREIILVGTSIGGAVAIDYTLNSERSIDGLMLIDAQAFIDKKESFMTKLPGVADFGAEVLRSQWLRKMAIEMAYHSDLFKNEDTLRISRLHCWTSGWKEATVDFVRGAGYCLSGNVADVNVPTRVLWGENDRVLPKADAGKFQQCIPDCSLEFVKDCGHSPHIEKPHIVAEAIGGFIEELSNNRSRGGQTT